MGISRNTVKSALACDGPPKYQRAAKGSVVDAVEPRIVNGQVDVPAGGQVKVATLWGSSGCG